MIASLVIIKACSPLGTPAQPDLSKQFGTTGQREIAAFLENLRSSTKLRVENSYVGGKPLKDVFEEFVIEDQEKIKNLIDVVIVDSMLNVRYEPAPQYGQLATKNFISIYLYKNGEEIGWFYVIAGNIFRMSGSPTRYESVDGLLLGRVREAVGATKGSWSGKNIYRIGPRELGLFKYQKNGQ